MEWQRFRIGQPCIGNDLAQGEQVALTQLAEPELLQWLQPEQGKPEFLLQIGLEWRRDMNLSR